ncbi:MAG: phasin family protein [Candidatus Competibacteraceae bacterium]|nr:phasin family protein [Candidatus Competibacteraceae bacterium]
MVHVTLKNMTEAPAVANIHESANRIWLAGLGAFSRNQEEGEKLFQALVKEGEQVEKRAKEMTETKVEETRGKVVELQGKATQQFGRLEELFQERVAQVLHRLGVPTQEDIQEVSRRVEELNQSVQALKK